VATGRIGTTPVLTTRWSKAPTGGTTSLSGLDDNSVSLVYSVGYEAVYRNGVLLSRTNDYTATNGTTITLIDATITGDIIEVFANQTIPLTDTYSQTVSDGRFIKNTLTTTTGDIIYASAANTPARLAIGSTDQVLKVSGGIPAWGAASGGMTELASGSLSGASVSITTISGSYKELRVVIRNYKPATNDRRLRMRINNITTVNYTNTTSTFLGTGQSFGGDAIEIQCNQRNDTANGLQIITLPDYTNTVTWQMVDMLAIGNDATTPANVTVVRSIGALNSAGAVTRLDFFPEGGNFTSGTYILYGVS